MASDKKYYIEDAGGTPITDEHFETSNEAAAYCRGLKKAGVSAWDFQNNTKKEAVEPLDPVMNESRLFEYLYQIGVGISKRGRWCNQCDKLIQKGEDYIDIPSKHSSISIPICKKCFLKGYDALVRHLEKETSETKKSTSEPGDTKHCPSCETPNQFGELCHKCELDQQREATPDNE